MASENQWGTRIGSFLHLLTDEEVLKRKAYFELDEEDERRLEEAGPALVPRLQEVIDSFYDYLLSHAPTREILLSRPGLVAGLKTKQADYFLSLTSGSYDRDYFEARLRVGLVHEGVGVSPRWYLGALDKCQRIVTAVLAEGWAGDPERLRDTLTSLSKIVSLDKSLALDAYLLAAQERIERETASLAKAHRELRELQTTKRRLTDMIVHDLQNPLAGISAFLQLLKEKSDGLDQDERFALQEAMTRCGEVSELVMDVLQMGRAEEGRLDTCLEEVNVVEVAHSTVRAFSLVAHRGGRELTLEAQSDRVLARTDRGLLRRILDNLTRNALRHTPRGTRVLLRVHSGPPISLSVEDDGPGLPRDARERLSAPAASYRPDLPSDSGIGLAFCRMATDALGMRLRVESEPGKGSRFALELETAGPLQDE